MILCEGKNRMSKCEVNRYHFVCEIKKNCFALSRQLTKPMGNRRNASSMRNELMFGAPKENFVVSALTAIYTKTQTTS
jgi:hypothetical protein